MKEIWIDNYSISETAPGHYFSEPRGLSELDMKQILLNYIQGPTEEKLGRW